MNNTTPPANSNGRPGNSLRLILILLVVGLGAGVAYLLVRNTQLSEQVGGLNENKTELETEIRQLDEQIVQMKSDVQNKDIQLEEKDKKIEQLTAQVANTRSQITALSNAGKLTNKQLDEYKFKVDQMEYYLQKYQAEINRLKEENQRLTSENQELSSQVKSKDSLATQLNQEKTLYKTKLDAAAILKAVEFSFAAINRRGKESPGKELRESQLESLKVCFKLLENEVANTGNRAVYIVIKGPDGSLYRSTDGGSFTTSGQQLPYSAQTSVNYTRITQQVCLTYPKPADKDFTPGAYKVTAYTDGFEVGSGSFTVK